MGSAISAKVPETARSSAVLRALSVLAVLLIASAAAAQWGERGRQHPVDTWGDPDHDGWVILENRGGCFGGERCRSSGQGLELPLEPRPVVAIRFHAHDNIGDRHGGLLQVRIDHHVLEPSLEVPRHGNLFELNVDRLSGHMLVLEVANNDEVELSEVAVRYAPDWGSHMPGTAGGWQSYSEAGRCIGGSRCPIPGDRIEIPLHDAPITGVRFFAHDRVGDKGKGHVQVRIDGVILAHNIDIKKAGKVHELEVPEVRGQRLVIEEIAGDEVVIEEIEIRYAANSYHHPPSEPWHQGGWRSYEVSACIGGSRCPNPASTLELPLEWAPITAVRFFAHDRVGDKGRAHLQVRIDHTIIAGDIDVKKAGQVHELEVSEISGRQLVFEEIGGDEAIIEEVEVHYADSGSGSGYRPHHPRQGGRWQAYPAAGACIGGQRCRHNGEVIVVNLQPAPILRIRFLARDDVGDRHNGHLSIAIDGSVLAPDLDVPRHGETFEIEAHGHRGRQLILEAITGDEVVVEDIEVEYGH